MKVDDQNLLESLNYFAWCTRANCFRDDFVKRFSDYGINTFGWGNTFAKSYAYEVFRWFNEKGLIQAYQNMITDDEGKLALINAIKIQK